MSLSLKVAMLQGFLVSLACPPPLAACNWRALRRLKILTAAQRAIDKTVRMTGMDLSFAGYPFSREILRRRTGTQTAAFVVLLTEAVTTFGQDHSTTLRRAEPGFTGS